MKGCSIGTKSHHKWARQGKRRRTGPFSESPRTLTTPRLGSEHVVTRRWLRQLLELCVPLRGPSTRAIVPKSIENGELAFPSLSRRNPASERKLAQVSSCPC